MFASRARAARLVRLYERPFDRGEHPRQVARWQLQPQRDGKQAVRRETSQSERDAFHGEHVIFCGGVAAAVGLIRHDQVVSGRAHRKMAIRLLCNKSEVRRSRAALTCDVEHALIRLDPGDRIPRACKRR